MDRRGTGWVSNKGGGITQLRGISLCQPTITQDEDELSTLSPRSETGEAGGAGMAGGRGFDEMKAVIASQPCQISSEQGQRWQQ